MTTRDGMSTTGDGQAKEDMLRKGHHIASAGTLVVSHYSAPGFTCHIQARRKHNNDHPRQMNAENPSREPHLWGHINSHPFSSLSHRRMRCIHHGFAQKRNRCSYLLSPRGVVEAGRVHWLWQGRSMIIRAHTV